MDTRQLIALRVWMRHWVVPPLLALLLGLLAVAAEHYILALNGGLPVP